MYVRSRRWIFIVKPWYNFPCTMAGQTRVAPLDLVPYSEDEVYDQQICFAPW